MYEEIYILNEIQLIIVHYKCDRKIHFLTGIVNPDTRKTQKFSVYKDENVLVKIDDSGSHKYICSLESIQFLYEKLYKSDVYKIILKEKGEKSV